MDKDNHVHITYLLTGADAGSGEIHYLTNSSGDWESMKLNDKYFNPAQCDVSMALDSDGHVHLVSYFPSIGGLYSGIGGPGYMTNAPDGQWSEPALSPRIQYRMRVFPNPACGITNITIDLDLPGHVSLEYIDLLGNKVRSLLDEQMPAGDHSLRWNTGKLPEGCYILRLRTREEDLFQRVILIR